MNPKNVVTISCFAAIFIIVLASIASIVFLYSVYAQSVTPYNSTLIKELIKDPDKASQAITLFGNDTLKAAWSSGKGASQFTTEEKIMLERAVKELNQFDRTVDEVGDKVANSLIK